MYHVPSSFAWLAALVDEPICLDSRMRGGDARKQSEFPSVVPRFNLDAVGAWRFLAIVLVMCSTRAYVHTFKLWFDWYPFTKELFVFLYWYQTRIPAVLTRGIHHSDNGYKATWFISMLLRLEPLQEHASMMVCKEELQCSAPDVQPGSKLK